MNIEDVVMVAAGRTARGKFGGILRDQDIDDISAQMLKGIFKKYNIDPKIVDYLYFGQTRQAGYGGNPARAVAYKAGIPIEVPSYTINMACISAMQGVINGIRLIMTGEADVVVAGGMENMSGGCYLLKGVRWGLRSGHGNLIDDLYIPCRLCGMNMVATADKLAKKYGITKEEQDSFSYESHKKAIKAQDNGYFIDEIIPIEIKQRKKTILFDTDECIRRDTSLEKISKLKPVYNGGTVTAGNACPLTDGANAVILTSRKKAKELGLKPLASFLSYNIVGVDPSIMGVGPIHAIPKALEKAGVKIDDIDLIEYNEAFACVVLAGIKEFNIDPSKINIFGGAISLGHPTGSTGSRLLITLHNALKRENKTLGLATLCGGGGLGGAIVLKAEY